MNTSRYLATLVLLAGCDLCNTSPSTLQQGFDRIVVNETTVIEIVALLGPPAYQSKSIWPLNSVDVTVLSYFDGRYEASFTVVGSPLGGVAPRAIAKEIHPRKQRS
jgi:hypothetical protein